jgi:hypothetical protein
LIVMEIERVVLKAPFVDIVDNRFCCTAVSAGNMYHHLNNARLVCRGHSVAY